MNRKLNRLPLYVQIKNHILDDIESGRFAPDTQLPTEMELMNLFGVGRATVRSALSELEYESRIYKRHGIGTFVSQPPSQSLSFEPLISLTYSLKRLGVQIESEILKSETVAPSGDLLKGWAENDTVGHLKRLRIAGGYPVAVEDSYFTLPLYNIIIKADPNESIARIILSQKSAEIGSLDMRIKLRKPTDEEYTLLKMKPDERVSEMIRWIYNDDSSSLINFVKFVLPENLMKYPIIG